MRQATAKFLGISPQFRVPDLVKTAEYYRDVLGFSLDGYFGDPPVFTMAWRDWTVIQLGKEPDPAKTTRPASGVGYNAYVFVDKLDLFIDELKERGAEIIEGPVMRIYNIREVVVRDCNGLILCFAQTEARS